MKNVITFFVSLFFVTYGISQQTKSLHGQSPTASIQDVAWIAGNWQGEGLGGIVQEIWSEPLAGAMMGSFRLISSDKVGFYELCVIREVGQTILLQLKHFNHDLKGWEEKDQTVDFPLVKLEKDRVFFNNFTFKKVSDTEMHVYVVVSGEGDNKKEAAFIYHRK